MKICNLPNKIRLVIKCKKVRFSKSKVLRKTEVAYVQYTYEEYSKSTTM